AEFAAEMIPVYPASAKASSWMIARAVKTVLDPLDAGEDPLPAELRERHGLVGRAEAIRAIHRPLDQPDLTRARERLQWDEAFLLQAALAQRRREPAIRPMLQGVNAGGQAALLAPTEVLAQQHYRSVTGMLGPLAQAGQLGAAEHATGVALLTGSVGAAARRVALSDVFTGDAGIVIGTHALLEEQVQFADLGLVVIDEQHRFGVEQRDAL